ncbi:MAG: hypothetical protein NZZ41_05420 [Candidatus Dojkabacteria bacterium]|nr:hypothetical protein [Candidatus Dojkabacteria bacterium]
MDKTLDEKDISYKHSLFLIFEFGTYEIDNETKTNKIEVHLKKTLVLHILCCENVIKVISSNLSYSIQYQKDIFYSLSMGEILRDVFLNVKNNDDIFEVVKIETIKKESEGI